MTKSKLLDLSGLPTREVEDSLNREIATLRGWLDIRYRSVNSRILSGMPTGDECLNGISVRRTLPAYATSADAILPALEKYRRVEVLFSPARRSAPGRRAQCKWYMVSINTKEGEPNFMGEAETLSRAACLAFLRANKFAVRLR